LEELTAASVALSIPAVTRFYNNPEIVDKLKPLFGIDDKRHPHITEEMRDATRRAIIRQKRSQLQTERTRHEEHTQQAEQLEDQITAEREAVVRYNEELREMAERAATLAADIEAAELEERNIRLELEGARRRYDTAIPAMERLLRQARGHAQGSVYDDPAVEATQPHFDNILSRLLERAANDTSLPDVVRRDAGYVLDQIDPEDGNVPRGLNWLADRIEKTLRVWVESRRKNEPIIGAKLAALEGKEEALSISLAEIPEQESEIAASRKKALRRIVKLEQDAFSAEGRVARTEQRIDTLLAEIEELEQRLYGDY